MQTDFSAQARLVRADRLTPIGQIGLAATHGSNNPMTAIQVKEDVRRPYVGSLDMIDLTDSKRDQADKQAPPQARTRP